MLANAAPRAKAADFAVNCGPCPPFALPIARCFALSFFCCRCCSCSRRAAASRTTPIRGRAGQNILYSAFTERPKHLDPVQSYSEDEITFTAQIYEPPLQYHYLKRPYTLIPATSRERAGAALLRRRGPRAAAGRADPPRSPQRYEIRIRPGIRYQPHPAFAHRTPPGSRSTTILNPPRNCAASSADRRFPPDRQPRADRR
jgi:hypothetical protein